MTVNPETLDLKSLPSVALESRSKLPEQSAIYFAIDSLGNIQYIGQTANLKQRWIGHHRFKQLKSLDGVRIAYMFLDSDLLPSVEKALIDWFKPALNNSQSEKKRQLNFTPIIPEEEFNELIAKLENHYGVKNISVLISQAVIDFVRLKKL